VCDDGLLAQILALELSSDPPLTHDKHAIGDSDDLRGFVTPASACRTLVGALAKGHEEDQLRGMSLPA
jgi:hypothetical protein